jgi:glycine hydroxymethyltransferase
MALPNDSSDDATHNPSGIRLGVQELTRWGMKEEEMDAVAEFYKRIIIEREPVEKVKADIMAYKAQYPDIHYCFPVE